MVECALLSNFYSKFEHTDWKRFGTIQKTNMMTVGVCVAVNEKQNYQNKFMQQKNDSFKCVFTM